MTRDIKQLLISQAIANLADVFFRVVIIANIFTISGSVIATSMVPILIGLSSFLASFLVPLVTKRIALNRVLFLTQFGKTIVLALLLSLLYHYKVIPVLILYLFIMVISILDGFAAPISYAIIPRYADDLGKANAALSMSGEGVQLVGWGLGGLLFAALGLQSSTLVILLLFIMSTLLMFLLPVVRTEQVEEETNLETVVKGWRLVIKRPKLRLLVGTNLLEIMANTIWVSSVILVFVTKCLHQTESYWGYANTAYSVGILLGGSIIFKLSDKILRYKWQSIVLTLFSLAVVTVLIIQYSTTVTFLMLSLMTGVLSQIKEIPESVLLQESVDEMELVNVYSVFEVISTLAFSGFVLIMSSITETIGVTFSFWVAVACLIIEALWVFVNRKRLE